MRPFFPVPLSTRMTFHRLLCTLALLLGLAHAASAQDRALTINPPQLTPSLVADTTAIAPGRPFTIGVRLAMAPGWHTYWQFGGDSGMPARVEWTLPEGFKAGPIQWPIPTPHMDASDMLTYVYEGVVLLPVEITPPAQLPPGVLSIKAAINWLVCEEICVPGSASVELTLPTGDAQPANSEFFAKWRALVPRTDAAPFKIAWDLSKADAFTVRIEGLARDVKAEFFPLPPAGVKPGHPAPGEIAGDGAIVFPIVEGGAANLAWRGVVAVTHADGRREGWLVAAGTSAPVSQTAPPGSGGLLLTVLAAFLGGLIMNVMPCVLPVIALKIFGFVHQAGEAPARVFRLGLAFNAGVFAFFLGLALAVVKLKTEFNWGYQFQNPFILAGLIALIFIFALSLLGVFEIALTGGAANTLGQLSRREGYSGAFMHGLFTTLLGTSCTAPFLSTSLGYAVTQPTPIIFLLFAAMAAGMCLPYFLLTAHPAWLRFVPKPGMWMERVKQLMGFAMLAVAVWLFTILGLRGSHVVTGMSWFLLTLGVACWLFGTFHQSFLARAAFLLIPVAGYYLALHAPLTAPRTAAATHVEPGGIAWEPYSEERLAAALASGAPVFVDFTAEWCVNCKAYEKLVLATEPVGAKFREKKIVPLKADWTDADPVITRALKSFNRVGVPLYILYRPGEPQPVVMDGLTTGVLIGEIDKIKN